MMQSNQLKKTFLLSFIISLCISALIGMGVFLFGSLGHLESRIILSTLAIGGFSLTGLCCSILVGRKKHVVFSYAGIGISLFALLLSLFVIWGSFSWYREYNNILWDALVIAIVLAFSFAQISLILLIDPKNNPVKYAKLSTIFFVSIVAVMLTLIVLFANDVRGFDFFFRLLGVFAILDVVGTIATPLLHKALSIK